MDLNQFDHLELLGGFLVLSVKASEEPMIDAIGREALARTSIVGREFEITLAIGMSDKELSVTLYHEVLEAAAVASDDPPESMIEFNEDDFDAAAYAAHAEFGPASPASLNHMLRFHGFDEL
ncbi:MAG: hypothetical protein J0L73_23340 [Verrucomicrobia bacterium]|nr:hypothetical protein [Verrucomicrobiota bacterium]